MSIPKFSDLPLDESGPHHNAWGLYGTNDQLGTLNRLSNDIVTSAAKEIKTGKRISLNWPLDAQGSLPFFGRQAFHQKLYQKPPRIVNDDVWTFNTQSSSQWDGLRHFGYQKEEVFYNGVTLDDIHGTNGKPCSNVNGIGAWSEQGIVGRGVLLDYHEWRVAQGREHDAFATSAIPLADLKAVAKAQGTEFRFGDILLVRSGYMDAYNKIDKEKVSALRERQTPSFAGVEQSEEMLQFMWENFAACAGDQPGWEAWPTQKDWSCHEVMLAGWGMPIGELFDLEALGKHCKETSRYEFFVVSEPTNVPGGVASPPNILAIF
jgi:hypothetical protein